MKTIRIICHLVTIALCVISVYANDVPQNAIPFIYNQHIYIQGFLRDSIPMSIIYDTGASSIYLDKYFAATHSLCDEASQSVSGIISGAGNGEEEKVSLVIEPLEISNGKWKYKDEYSPIIDFRKILGRYVDGMVGNNAFKGKALMVNYSNGYLLPLNKINDELRDGYVEVPAQFKDNRIFVEAELKVDSAQTIRGNFLVDLGCGATLILTNHSRKSLNLSNKKTAKLYVSNNGIGGDGTEVMFRADSFKFLDELNNVVAYASYSDKGALSKDSRYIGIVGNPILCHYDLIIDYANKKLYAKRSASTDIVCHTASKTQMGYIDRTDICDGWIVSSMYDGGIAQQAGFEIGDVIISINDRPVKDISWEEQRKGLGLSGETVYKVRKANGDIVTYVLNIQDEII